MKKKAEAHRGKKVKDDSDAMTTKAGAGGELHQIAGSEGEALTTNQGVVIADNQNSLRSSQRGPTLLEDFILREKTTHFDHERIPERIVHARGSAAHGYFELTESLEAIEAGAFPEWEFGVQLFTQAEADAFPFDHLDATKLIPEEHVPLRIIGRMVLDRWPDNFFSETEQVAFCPSHLVPGIDFSNDPLLQGRLFSYLDTQLSRLGSPNFHQIPVNAPKCPFANLQRDGHMQMAIPVGRVNYEPNSLSDSAPREVPSRGFQSTGIAEDGEKGRIRAESFSDHYSQARMFYKSQTLPEQAHIASALVFELSKVEHLHIREAMVGHLRHICEDLATRVAVGLGLDPLPPAPKAAAPVQELELSPALQLIGKMKDTLEGRCVGILIANGSDGAAIKKLMKAITGEGATAKIVAPKVGGATLADGTFLPADGQLAGTPSVLFDAVAVILSDEGAEMLATESAALDFVHDAFGHLKAIAVDEGGHALLRSANVGEDAGVMDASNLEAFLAAAKTRQWDREPLIRTLA